MGSSINQHIEVYVDGKKKFTGKSYCFTILLEDVNEALWDIAGLGNSCNYWGDPDNVSQKMKQWLLKNKVEVRLSIPEGKTELTTEQLRVMGAVGKKVFGARCNNRAKQTYFSDGYNIDIRKPLWKEYAAVCWYRYPMLLKQKDVAEFIENINKYKNFWYPFLRLESVSGGNSDYFISNFIEEKISNFIEEKRNSHCGYYGRRKGCVVDRTGSIVYKGLDSELDISPMLGLRMLLTGEKTIADGSLLDFLSSRYYDLEDYFIDRNVDELEELFCEISPAYADAITKVFSKSRAELKNTKNIVAYY